MNQDQKKSDYVLELARSRRKFETERLGHILQSKEKNHVLVADVFMPKIGRNDFCYCGSGLKHKKCCFGLLKPPPKPTESK